MTQLPQRNSLVAQTESAIVQEIRAGRWSKWLPGEHELCAALHVSRRTVRAALETLEAKGLLKCAKGKRRRIVSQPSKKPVASNRVILLTPVPLLSLSPFGVFLIDHLRKHLAEGGYVLETHASRVPYRARMPHELENLEASLRPGGWVLLQSTETMQRWFAEKSRPCVIVGSRYPDIELPSVDTDYNAVCKHAVGRFLARGYRWIALLNPLPGAAGDEKTREGFLEAARVSSTPMHAEVLHHDGTVDNICARLEGLLARAPRPAALLVSKPRHVLTVLGHLLKRGVRVPQEVAVISRDDDSFLEDMVPTVARYSRTPGIFASKTSAVVLEMAQGKRKALDYKIMPRFIQGETLG